MMIPSTKDSSSLSISLSFKSARYIFTFSTSFLHCSTWRITSGTKSLVARTMSCMTPERPKSAIWSMKSGCEMPRPSMKGSYMALYFFTIFSISNAFTLESVHLVRHLAHLRSATVPPLVVMA